jgi:hypothetical protein
VERVRVGRALVQDVEHPPSPDDQRVRDQATVAAPGHGLGAHDRDGALAGEGFDLVEWPMEKITDADFLDSAIPTNLAWRNTRM